MRDFLGFWLLVIILLGGCQDSNWLNNTYVDICAPLYTKAKSRQDSLIVDSTLPVTIGYGSTKAYSCLSIKELLK